MSNINFRGLNANEIECRPAQIGAGWVQLLLYKDARCDMNILDEMVGAENWAREHYECKGNLFCKVGININFNNDKEPYFIYKSDCGSESNTEKEKGESSDSFKRACINWGIGRELYTKIPIFIRLDTKKNERTGKFELLGTNNFTVDDIIINKIENKIEYISIIDKNGKQVFSWTYDVVNKIKEETKLDTNVECNTLGNGLNGKIRVRRQ